MEIPDKRFAFSGTVEREGVLISPGDSTYEKTRIAGLLEDGAPGEMTRDIPVPRPSGRAQARVKNGYPAVFFELLIL